MDATFNGRRIFELSMGLVGELVGGDCGWMDSLAHNYHMDVFPVRIFETNMEDYQTRSACFSNVDSIDFLVILYFPHVNVNDMARNFENVCVCICASPEYVRAIL